MKKLYAVALSLSLLTSYVKADCQKSCEEKCKKTCEMKKCDMDNTCSTKRCDMESKQACPKKCDKAACLQELIDLTMQKDHMLRTMESVFDDTTRNCSEDQKDLGKQMMNKFAEKFDSDETKTELMAIYDKAYTQEDVSKLLEFYKSDVGQKTLEKMPEIMSETSQMSMKLMQEVMTEVLPEGSEASVSVTAPQNEEVTVQE